MAIGICYEQVRHRLLVLSALHAALLRSRRMIAVESVGHGSAPRHSEKTWFIGLNTLASLVGDKGLNDAFFLSGLVMLSRQLFRGEHS
jgi:hypothetical protein